jgi:predicted dehydrogenase/flavin reductase (DIM6/NTAB) family NADH-FMN oxidoreductase RutF
MRRAAATLWDTKIQCVCAVVSAREGNHAELWLCANFGQVSLTDPRIAVNPNRLYPIETAIRRERLFAINVLSATQRDIAIRLAKVRRRSPNKATIIALDLKDHERHGIPYAPACFRTLFCEAEEFLDTGDHTLIIARVLETRLSPGWQGERPLLYGEVAGTPAKYPRLTRAMQWVIGAVGIKERAQEYLEKRRGLRSVNLAAKTYEEGGQTEAEIQLIQGFGLLDTGRRIAPPQRAPAALRRRIGVCVVGVGQWGAFHCRLFRSADPRVDLYVCGRRRERVERLAAAAGAKGAIIGLERAVEDKRVEALSLALPHQMHAAAAILTAQAGKHALVEKPVARTLAEADAMITAAHEAGTILMVAEDVHFRPAVRAAVHMIDAGDVGEPLYLMAHGGGAMRPRGWKADPSLMGGGVLMDLGVHYVRAMRLLMGEPDEVLGTRGMQIDTKNGGEDSVQVLLRSRFGWQAHMLLSWAGPRGHAPDVIVCGERGVLHLWPARNYVDWYPVQPRPLPRLLSYVRPGWLAEMLIRPEMQRVRRRIAGQDRQGYLSEVREFLAAVTERRVPASPPEDARRDLEIVLSSYESISAGHWTPIAAYPAASPVYL